MPTQAPHSILTQPVLAPHSVLTQPHIVVLAPPPRGGSGLSYVKGPSQGHSDCSRRSHNLNSGLSSSESHTFNHLKWCLSISGSLELQHRPRLCH